jgi:hypothetical protein
VKIAYHACTVPGPVGRFSVFLLGPDRVAAVSDPRPIAARLQAALNMPAEQAAQFEASMPCVLWAGIDMARAQQCESFLRSIGCVAAIAPDGTDPRVFAPAPQVSAASGSLRESGAMKPWMQAGPGGAPAGGEFALNTLELPSLSPMRPRHSAPAQPPPPPPLSVRQSQPAMAAVFTCPKCGYAQSPGQQSCGQCGVIFAKVRPPVSAAATAAAPAPAPASGPTSSGVVDAISSQLKGFLKR